MMNNTFSSTHVEQDLKLPYQKLSFKQKVISKILNSIRNIDTPTADHPSDITLNYVADRIKELKDHDYSYFYYEDYQLLDREMLELREIALILESYFDKYHLFRRQLAEFVEVHEKLNNDNKLSSFQIVDLSCMRIALINLKTSHIKRINKKIAKLLKLSPEYRFLKTNEAVK